MQVIIHHEEHQASVATAVTPTPDLSTMTQALSTLSNADLQQLKTNIQTLLEPEDAPDDAKLPSLPDLPIVDIADDLSLGSLDHTNFNSNDITNYLSSSIKFNAVLPNIPFSLVGTRGSSTHPSRWSLQTLTTNHLKEIKDLGKLDAPQTVPHNVTIPNYVRDNFNHAD